uniref:Uncharacterized protein ycf20 n=1 Tax=Taenioma perpusillum TaxID=210852 RepID=A0A1Z1MQV9_9FLOR|nr:hypothetical protein [Taenioma perpusillum]ARW68467.1 hypothetical protein [Taenioma perpusillum]
MLTNFLVKSIIKILNHKFYLINLSIISLTFGFFIASILSTLPAQTGDWGIISAAIIVTFNEIISKIIYCSGKKNKYFLKLLNNIKIGILYGLFVDAFKLGS